MPVFQQNSCHSGSYHCWRWEFSCYEIYLSLSNLQMHKSSRVTTCWAMTWPDNVLLLLLLERSLRRTPFGELNSFMREQDAPESKRMWNNCLLCIVPIMLTVQTVAGVSFLGMIFGPQKQYLLSSSKTSNMSQEAMKMFPTDCQWCYACERTVSHSVTKKGISWFQLE